MGDVRAIRAASDDRFVSTHPALYGLLSSKKRGQLDRVVVADDLCDLAISQRSDPAVLPIEVSPVLSTATFAVAEIGASSVMDRVTEWRSAKRTRTVTVRPGRDLPRSRVATLSAMDSEGAKISSVSSFLAFPGDMKIKSPRFSRTKLSIPHHELSFDCHRRWCCR